MGDHEDQSPPPQTRRKVPALARLLAIASVGLMAFGLVLPLLGGRTAAVVPEGATGDRSAHAVGAEGLTGDAAPGSPAPQTGAAGAPYAGWGPSVFRVGFSFFVGFAVAFALRSFVKLAVVALGFFFLALFGLQYAGIIEVRWALLAERYDAVSGGIRARTAGLWGSMSQVLPSAASATAGLMAGFWRQRG